jgi:hypothetical protein
LVIDADGCYDPADFNDGLLLGLKGTMAHAELHFLRGRLLGGKLNVSSNWIEVKNAWQADRGGEKADDTVHFMRPGLAAWAAGLSGSRPGAGAYRCG